MNSSTIADSVPAGVSRHAITVLLVDDQAIIGEAVRQMLVDQSDITLHFCQDPTKALEMANRVCPTVILQDLVMPEVDGLTLVKFFRANPATREIPMIVLSSKEEPIVKAEAFAIGANDYLVKLPDRIELIARIRYHSQGYIRLLERNEAYAALHASRERLAHEIAAGVRFVESLLPPPLKTPVQIDWWYVPCAELGGDTLGYQWLDDENLALYLLDVSGHGLDSALFSVSIMNVLRARSLANTDFRQPGQVLSALNDAFPMEQYDNKFFTMWYGVYNPTRAELAWCNGGHPPPLLFAGGPAAAAKPQLLCNDNPMLGAFPGVVYETARSEIAPGSRLYVYSDGVHEIHKPDGNDWQFEEFMAFMSQPPSPGLALPEQLLRHVRQIQGRDLLDDDFSMLEVTF